MGVGDFQILSVRNSESVNIQCDYVDRCTWVCISVCTIVNICYTPILSVLVCTSMMSVNMCVSVGIRMSTGV